MAFDKVLGYDNNIDIEDESRLFINNDNNVITAQNTSILVFGAFIGVIVVLALVFNAGLYSNATRNYNRYKNDPFKHNQQYHHREFIGHRRGTDINGMSKIETKITNLEFLHGRKKK